ncbi:MAG: MerR family transcriptional regulator [Chloroflexota bacterium]|nr:MAG: MerR family transcriptional regulator [Chloroflexota bacterium]
MNNEQDQGELLSIGELARRTGVSARTIRYYEELGILPEPERTASGTRRYGQEYIFFVKGACLLKEIGFSLSEIQTLGWWCLGRAVPEEQLRDTQELLSKKMAVLDTNIQILTDIKRQAAKRTSKEDARRTDAIRQPSAVSR